MSNTYEYILVAMDYESEWIEVVDVQKANSKIVMKFLKRNLFLQIWLANGTY